jgi:ATP-dependent RNA helicase DHX57
MYNVDPFAAKKEVEKRQETAAKHKEKVQAIAEGGHKPGSSSTTVDELSAVPEVKMAHELRERVEEAIKQAFSDFPEANDEPTDFDSSQLSKQLHQFGFTVPQIRDAVEFLSSPSILSKNLLQLSSPLEASIEYLILNIPECDLPQRFLPSNNSSRSVISSAHSGTEDLKTRWMHDKMKSAGWPAHCVKEVTSTRPELLQNTQLLVTALDLYLVGRDWKNIAETDVPSGSLYALDPDEMEAMGARMSEEDSHELIMPLFSAPVELHVFTVRDKLKQIHPQRPSMYISSAQVPAYVRLHMLSLLLRASEDYATFMEPGEGFCMAAMRTLEASWAEMEDNGRPDMRSVMQFLVPATTVEPLTQVGSSQKTTKSLPQGRQQSSRGSRKDERSDSDVKRDFEAMCRDDKYKKMLQVRESLPVFGSKADFLEKLEKNRVVVVVGETGCGKTTQRMMVILSVVVCFSSALDP